MNNIMSINAQVIYLLLRKYRMVFYQVHYVRVYYTLPSLYTCRLKLNMNKKYSTIKLKIIPLTHSKC